MSDKKNRRIQLLYLSDGAAPRDDIYHADRTDRRMAITQQIFNPIAHLFCTNNRRKRGEVENERANHPKWNLSLLCSIDDA
ncbi:MAG: hypothetical protein Greene041619_1105 [Candidatus Peregrinibacteria bacterium Greene0416_19]|nr:MAG: hypothetical protein Greene041619_1105 [Candidatus Peregrinibacteria bacterium Greene0416_19]